MDKELDELTEGLNGFVMICLDIAELPLQRWIGIVDAYIEEHIKMVPNGEGMRDIRELLGLALSMRQVMLKRLGKITEKMEVERSKGSSVN